MPRKEDLNQIIKSIQLAEILFWIISRIKINVLVKYQTLRGESMPGGVKLWRVPQKSTRKGAFLHIIYKLALLLQFFLSEEIGEQRGA